MNQFHTPGPAAKRREMTPVLLILTASLVLATAGCVSTVDGSHTTALSFSRDKFEQDYPRSVEQVYAAAKLVAGRDGAIVSEFIPHDTTNEVRSLHAIISNCNVWIRAESKSSNPPVTALTVQARTVDHFANQVLVNQLDTEIAIQLEHAARQ